MTVPGHVDALGTLVLTDASDQPRDDLEWGIDENTSAAIRTEADEFNLAGYAGSLKIDLVEATVSPNWVAVCATPALTHIGRYRVKARCICPSTDTQVRLAWHSGEAPWTLNLPVAAHIDDTPIELDLGVVNIVEQEGTHAWTGKIDVKGDTIGTFEITDLFYIPAGRYGRARAPRSFDSPSVFAGRDEFNQTAGALTGKTLPQGGTWEAGGADADDFTVNATDHVAERAATDDDDGTVIKNGRMALAGATTYAAVAASVETTALEGNDNLYQGVVARYVDDDNWIVAVVHDEGFSGAIPALRIVSRVGGSTTFAGFRANVAQTGETVKVTLLVFADGLCFAYVNDELKLAVPVAAAATGQALEDGQVGIIDFYSGPEQTGPRTYDNFAAWVPEADHVIYSNQSMQLDHRSAQRENADGTRWGDVPSYTGRRLLVPPATRNGNTSRLVVKQAVNDLTSLPAAPANLCTNPSAVTNTTGWTNDGAGLVTFGRNVSPPAGLPSRITTAFRCVGNSDGDAARDDVAVEAGKSYRFSAYTYIDTSTATGVLLQIRNAATASMAVSPTLSTLDAWTRIEVSVTADATETWGFRVRQLGAGGADWYFTGVLIEEVPSLTATLTVQPRVLLTS